MVRDCKCDQFSQVKVCAEHEADCAVSLRISRRPCLQPIEKKKDRRPYKPDRTARRNDASRRCLSAAALVNSHQAGEAYSNFERMTTL